jgi:predicted amidohydrolase YtcJ
VLDTSLSRVLDAWEQVERETGRISQLRCSIVHADGASEANLARVAALRAGVLVQSRLLLEGADYVRAWGQEAADAAPRIGVMRKLGIPVGGGSDGTRANRYSPWTSIWWLATGRSIDDATRRHARDRLSRHDAIASYTRDAAWFTGEDGWRGRLSPGYDADLCVPTADPFECAEDVLYDLRRWRGLLRGCGLDRSSQRKLGASALFGQRARQASGLRGAWRRSVRAGLDSGGVCVELGVH